MTSTNQSALPTSAASLIFPSASSNFSHTLSSLKRSRLSIQGRLSSILEDSIFVQRVAAQNNLPLIANERCGSWYIPPEKKAGSVYFKSTDGHQNQWKFSTRRLNLHLLGIIEKNNGCIVVDSTRRGKAIPDALSKTVPIWCCVMNRFLFPQLPNSHVLILPPNAVSESERTQIEAKLDGFLESMKALQLDIEMLRGKISKTLRLQFVAHGEHFIDVDQYSDFHTVICCSASRQEVGDDDKYIQGAGDDTENWAHDLTAEGFWLNRDKLTSNCTEEELRAMIEEIEANKTSSRGSGLSLVRPSATAPPISVGTLEAATSVDISSIDGMILCVEQRPISDEGDSEEVEIPPILRLYCPAGKLGSRTLRDQLSLLIPFMDTLGVGHEAPRLLIACPSGKDLSIGVALAMLCLYYDDEGNFTARLRTSGIDKAYIRQRLAKLSLALPNANPSRATLQSVNSFLMGRPD